MLRERKTDRRTSALRSAFPQQIGVDPTTTLVANSRGRSELESGEVGTSCFRQGCSIGPGGDSQQGVKPTLTLVANSRGEESILVQPSLFPCNGARKRSRSAMSLKLRADFIVPDETRRVAKAAFPKGCACLRIADALGCLYQDKQFTALFPRRGRPAEAPGRLALATVLQFTEGFSDRQTADAVRSRIDWKYALGLDLTDSGFDHSVLSEFRTRLVAGELELLLLDSLLERVQSLGLLKQRGRQRTDSTHVLAAVRTMNRLERAGETLRAALNGLAVAAPEWLKAVADPEWFPRYGTRVENFTLPKTDAGRVELAATIGLDGQQLLKLVEAADARLQLVSLPSVFLLRRVWKEQFVPDGDGLPRFREVKEMPSPASLSRLLGFRFCPSLADIGGTRFWG